MKKNDMMDLCSVIVEKYTRLNLERSAKNQGGSMKKRICRFCKRPVFQDNDALLLVTVVAGKELGHFFYLFNRTCHIFPSNDCPGCAEIAQYLNDTFRREGMPYNPDLKERFVSGYGVIMENVAKGNESI